MVISACRAEPSLTASPTPFPSASAIASVGSEASSGALLPDLRMARLKDVQLETTEEGLRLLRFSATIVNLGEGPMEVWAERDGQSLGSGVQRVYDADGGFGDFNTQATFFWAGDGHDHWHVTDMQGYRVERLDAADETAVSEKHGFCLFDNDPFDEPVADAPEDAAYSCPNEEDAGRIRMGLSVGWADIYPASLPNQFIDVTELSSGRYRLWAEADPVADDRPTGWFQESVEDNNLTWVDFELNAERGTIEVIEYGPSA